MSGTTYLERLRSEFDDITQGISLVLERAADEGRDLSDTEQQQIERDDKRRDELEAAIGVQTQLIERQTRVGDALGRVRMSVPTTTRTKPDDAPSFDLAREFPSAAHYAITLHRAWVKKDREAQDLLERATAHQLVADNPGIIPTPIVGPVISTFGAGRPFIASISTRDAPTQKFDRPIVTQDVAVDIQAAEKTLTASQKMLISPLPVSLDTYAGHLNISKQDIRWSQPSILQLVFESFGRAYARRTDLAACVDFEAAVTQTATVPTLDAAGLDAGFADALAQMPEDVYLDTFWMSPDVRAALTGIRQVTNGDKLYDLPITGSGGDVEGLRVVVDARFPAATAIVGSSEYVEWWEDLEGFLSVDEPDVLGQLVGYAGYGDLLVTVPDAFVQLTMPALPLGASTRTSAKKSTS